MVAKNLWYKLVLTAKSDKGVKYPKLNYWVDKETLRPIKVEYFTINDRHSKTAYYRGFKHSTSMGRIMAHEIFITDPKDKNRLTQMVYSNIRIENIPDSSFEK